MATVPVIQVPCTDELREQLCRVLAIVGEWEKTPELCLLLEDVTRAIALQRHNDERQIRLPLARGVGVSA